jgi:hypothetical protein
VVEKRGKRRVGADAQGGADAQHAVPEATVAKAAPAAAKAPIGRPPRRLPRCHPAAARAWCCRR